jgi:hypothetical protein
VPRKPQTQDGPDLFDLLDEIENGPSPCPHLVTKTTGWAHERDPRSDYFLEWVHADPNCRRSALPGHSKTPMSTMGWSRELQKDVPLVQRT